MTIQLPADLENYVRLEVIKGHFATEADLVAEAVRQYLRRAVTKESSNKTKPDPVLGSVEDRPEFTDRTVDDSVPKQVGEPVSPARKPIWERVLERSAAISDEEWDKLPTDLAEQHDHYLYGTPKRPPA